MKKILNKIMKKILIVEDNYVIYQLFCEHLERMGYEFMHAENGIEAVELFNENQDDISLILMDINMPKMGGEEAAVKIKEISPDIPIISQTAYNIYGRINDENKGCFVESIQKPIDMNNLKILINKYCLDEK